MNRPSQIASFVTVVGLLALPATAQRPHDRPDVFAKLIDCRQIAENAQRLACFDRAVDALDAAERRKDVVVVDREQMRQARKSLFGFTLPRIGLFGGGKEEVEADVSAIDGTIATVRRISSENWSIGLGDDAGIWETMAPIKFDPRVGQKIHISKATMGSYLGSFGSNKGVRFRRVK